MPRIILLRDLESRPRLTEDLRIAADREGLAERIKAHAARIASLGLTPPAPASVLRRDSEGAVVKFPSLTAAIASTPGVGRARLQKKLARPGWQQIGAFEFRVGSYARKTPRPNGNGNGCDSGASNLRTGNRSDPG